MVTQVIFMIFAAIALTTALAVVSMRNPVHAVLALVTCCIAIAGIWLLLSAEFLALTLVIVYVGAVMTLFLFVVMMLPLREREQKGHFFVNYAPYAALLIVTLISAVLIVISLYFQLLPLPAPYANNYSNISAIGEILYTKYYYPVELMAVLLLLAIVAALTLAKRPPHRRKSQIITKQLQVTAQERVTLINLPVEGDSDESQ
jgi:NADH-quinone oxidoreductase subunit J